MSANIFLFTLLLLCNQSMGDKCKKHLNSLATSQGLFVACSTTHAVPVEICVGCKELYDSMQEAMHSMVIDNCSSTYIDNDRLNVVSTVQSILNGLWDKAYCDDCSANQNFGVFYSKFTVFDECLNFTISNLNVCEKCLLAYQDLNNFYINLDQHNNAKVCYDIQDKMNRTRAHWSKDYGCCHRSFDITIFIYSSSFCAMLPLLFYAGMFLYGKRRERNHGVLDADAEDNAPLVSEEIMSSQQDPIIESLPTQVPIPAKTLSLDSDSDDSDYIVKNKLL